MNFIGILVFIFGGILLSFTAVGLRDIHKTKEWGLYPVVIVSLGLGMACCFGGIALIG